MLMDYKATNIRLPKLFVFSALLLLVPLSNANGDTNITSESKPAVNLELPKDMHLTTEALEKSEAMTQFAEILIELKKDGKFSSKSIRMLLEILKKDPTAQMPLQLLLAGISKNGKKYYKLCANKLYPLAMKNPLALKLNMVTLLTLTSSKKYKQAASLIENALLHKPPTPTAPQLSIYADLIITLVNIYEKQKAYAKGDKLLTIYLANKQFSNNFKLYNAAIVFYNHASKTASAKTSFWKSESPSTLYKKKLNTLLSNLQKMTTKIAIKDLGPVLEIYKKNNSLDKAKTLILNILLSSPNNQKALLLLGAIFQDLKQYQQAFRIWEQLKTTKKASAHYYFSLGTSAMLAKRYQAAIDAFEWYLISKPNDTKVIYQIAFAYFELGQYRKAIKKLKRLNTLPEGVFLKALSYKKLDMFKESIATLEKAETIAQKNKLNSFLSKNFYLTFAFICEKAKDIDMAIKVLNQLEKKLPDDPEVKNFLGYILADYNRELDRAEKLIKSALKSKPNSSAYLDSMAWVYYRKKEYELAEKYILKAIKADNYDTDPVISDHAGDIYHAIGNTKQALYYWNKAVHNYSPDINLNKVSDKIDTYYEGDF